MKNLTKLSLAITAASILMASAVQAGDDGIHVKGVVHPVCQIDGLPDTLDFGYNPTEGYSIHTDIDVTCNSKAGATVAVYSQYGGLTLNGDHDHLIKYGAGISIPNLGYFVERKGDSLHAEAPLPGSKMLAMGESGDFWLTLLDTPKFAGEYKDTLTVEITAE